MVAYQSELKVITAAKVPAGYVMTVTQKSPKQFRFSLVAKLQTYAPYTVKNLYKPNGRMTCCRRFHSPGCDSKLAADADFDDCISSIGRGADGSNDAVYPALRIDLDLIS